MKINELDMYYITDPKVDVDTKWGHTYHEDDLPAVCIILRGENDGFVATLWSTHSKGNEIIIEEGDITEDEVMSILGELKEDHASFGETKEEAYAKAFAGEFKGEVAKDYEEWHWDHAIGYGVPEDLNYPDNVL